ncbi:hypothetical protein D9O36_09320 [Zobellia amurskyensis]|uniref:Uncharacterized protein n=1 Tax=Zobellia amurskyensis TaxID=248905 RepID=A0A7X2ZTC2_9FLAO|nr:hypothetical protein [Zobellia amurskyensis]
MTRFIDIFNKILIYKNYKVFLLTFYFGLSLLFYLKWDYLYESWIESLKIINLKFEEPLSILIILYYCFFSFYAVMLLYYPLLIFDKKNDNNHQITFSKPKLNKGKSHEFIRDILLFIAFPILAILGILIWILFNYIWATYLILVISGVTALMLYLILKKVLKSIQKS